MPPRDRSTTQQPGTDRQARRAWLRRYGLAAVGFLLLFLVLLSPAPLSDSLFGSFDNLFIPVLGNTVVNRISSAVTGEFVGRAMHPANILAFGESAVGTGLFFVALRFLGATDVIAVYLVQAILLTLMALATTVLAERLTGKFSAGLLAAFIFTTSNFVWADIDNLPIHFYFFPLLSLYFLIRAAEEGRGRDLVIAGILGGTQAYYSLQVFAYQSILLAVFALLHGRSLWRLPWKDKALFAASYVLIALPLFLFYLNTLLRLHPVDPFPRSIHEQIYSLQLRDLTRALPGKLLSYPFVQDSIGGGASVGHSAFPGLIAPVLAIIGLWGSNRNKHILLLVGVVSLIFTLGTRVEIAGRMWWSPLVLFYTYFPLSDFLRVGLRAFTPVLLVLSILAAFGWARILNTVGARAGRLLTSEALVLVCGFIAAENISWPVNAFELIPYPHIPSGYVEYFSDKPEAMILDLPSKSTSWPFYLDDETYALWQTKHKRNILGGVNGYYPQSRIDVQEYTDSLPNPVSFRRLLRRGLTHVVWHKSPFLVCHPLHATSGCDPATNQRSADEIRGPDWLRTSPFLTLVFENDVLEIYEVTKPGRSALLPASN